MNIKTHKFRGKRWKIRFVKGREIQRNSVGECDYVNKVIAIRASTKGEYRLDTVVHEALHACYPDLSEDAIDEAATDIVRLLIRLGYKTDKEA